MSTPRPATSVPDAGDSLEQVEVDWDALPADWRSRNCRLRRAGETRAEQANRVRAQVVEGLIGAENLSFAEARRSLRPAWVRLSELDDSLT